MKSRDSFNVKIEASITGVRNGNDHGTFHFDEIITVKRHENIIEEFLKLKKNTIFEDIEDFDIESISIMKDCNACNWDEPGQRAHMEPGGCLNQDDSV